MTMMSTKAMQWHLRYGQKDWGDLSNSYKQVLKSYSKWSRTKFLTRSRIKTAKWNRNHPNMNNFKVFKCTVLKGKNVTPELMLKFKTLFSKGKSKGAQKFKHLHAKGIYNKMLEVNK